MIVYTQKSQFYVNSTVKFSNNTHIFKSTLEAYLNPAKDTVIRKRQFINKSYIVTGIDFFERSIKYIRNNTHDIRYSNLDDVELNYKNECGIITLMYCNFGILSDENIKIMSKKICTVVRPDGDVIYAVAKREGN